MGFITSPLEFSEAEARPTAKRRKDAQAQVQTESPDEIENHQVSAASSVVASQAAGEEIGDLCQNDAAVAPLSGEPPFKR